MKISKKWLQEFVEVENMQELSEKFNLMSQENTYYKLVDVKNVVVGEILEVTPHADATKLNVLKVDVGSEILQIVCGAPNVGVNKKVIVSLIGAVLPGDFEIKKSKIRGVESFGMCCSLSELGIKEMLHGEDGIHILENSAIVGSNAIEYLNLDDEIIELDLTPNRGDLLSVVGAAYDTCAILDKKISLKTAEVEESNEENQMSLVVETNKCLEYNFRLIKNIKVKESPAWLKFRLMASGIRPINNVVDITNYVLLETGHPLHAFDLAKFNGDTVLVRNAKKDELITTLDKVERKLNENDIVITNGTNPECIGGVMGGLNSAVSETTTEVLLEAAVFESVTIRNTARRLDLRSESSNRFEKGLDASTTIHALNLAAKMLAELADGTVLKNVKSYQSLDLSDKVVEIDLAYLEKQIGISLELKTVVDIYNRLGFKVETNDNSLKVNVPIRRNDVNTKQDLLEEFVRIYGFDNIPLTLTSSSEPGGLSKLQKRDILVKNILTGIGLNEAITYSLVSNSSLNDYTIKELTPVKLMSPLSEERAVLRQTPLNGLIDVLSYNVKRKANDNQFFEISTVYSEGRMDHLLGMVFSGLQSSTSHQSRFEEVDFYYVKGIVERLLKNFNLEVEFKKPSVTNKNFNIFQTAYIYYQEEVIGFITNLHPLKSKELDLKTTYLAEIDLKYFELEQEIRYQEISKYPKITRDLTLEVKRDLESIELVKKIESLVKEDLIDVIVFDVYQGEKIEKDLKALSLKLTFGSDKKTLELDEVSQKVDQLLLELVDFGAKLR